MQNHKFHIVSTAVLIFLCLASILLQVSLNLNLALCIGGSFFIYLVTLGSYLLLVQKQNIENPRKFVNSMMMSTMLKLFGCGLAAFAIIYANKPAVPKSSIFFLMLAYIVFATVESRFVMQLNKRAQRNK
jgi:amino acid transporter